MDGACLDARLKFLLYSLNPKQMRTPYCYA